MVKDDYAFCSLVVVDDVGGSPTDSLKLWGWQPRTLKHLAELVDSSWQPQILVWRYSLGSQPQENLLAQLRGKNPKMLIIVIAESSLYLRAQSFADSVDAVLDNHPMALQRTLRQAARLLRSENGINRAPKLLDMDDMLWIKKVAAESSRPGTLYLWLQHLSRRMATAVALARCLPQRRELLLFKDSGSGPQSLVLTAVDEAVFETTDLTAWPAEIRTRIRSALGFTSLSGRAWQLNDRVQGFWFANTDTEIDIDSRTLEFYEWCLRQQWESLDLKDQRLRQLHSVNDRLMTRRDVFELYLRRELGRARRNHFAVTLVGLRLKTAVPISKNERQAVGQWLGKQLRAEDLLCVENQTEYYLALPHTNLKAAFLGIDRIVRQLRDQLCKVWQTGSDVPSFEAAACEFPLEAEDAHDMIISLHKRWDRNPWRWDDQVSPMRPPMPPWQIDTVEV